MPTPPNANAVNQVLPNQGVTPYIQQMNFGQMVGACSDANPDWDPESIKQRLNEIVRDVLDRRTWYSLMIRGQIQTQKFVIGGQVQLTNGVPFVQGTGTSWDLSLVGKCFRVGYNTPVYVIDQVDPTAQVLTLEMPWGGPNLTSSGYYIAQYYYPLGSNIKYIHAAKNMLMAWRLHLNFNQQSLDAVDPWRMNTLSPCALGQMPLGRNGEYMVELWPVPNLVQALPFIATVQPPNLVDDNDSLPAYIRADLITRLGRAEALVYRGPKVNKYYDMTESQRLRGEAENIISFMQLQDENLYRQDVKMRYEEMRWAPWPGGHGATYAINHGVEAGEGSWDW